MTDSSAPGFLLPSGSPFPVPLGDAALDTFLQAMVCGITGFTSDYVRPRWQPQPPRQPPLGADWIAIGVQNIQSDTNAVVVHAQTTTTGVSADIVQRHEVLEVLCSIYGNNAGNTASLIREGLYLAQNRENLQTAGMGLQKVGEILNLSQFINEQWYRRLDMSVFIVRNVTRVYPVDDLLSSSGTVETSSVNAIWATANQKGS